MEARGASRRHRPKGSVVVRYGHKLNDCAVKQRLGLVVNIVHLPVVVHLPRGNLDPVDLGEQGTLKVPVAVPVSKHGAIVCVLEKRANATFSRKLNGEFPHTVGEDVPPLINEIIF